MSATIAPSGSPSHAANRLRREFHRVRREENERRVLRLPQTQDEMEPA